MAIYASRTVTVISIRIRKSGPRSLRAQYVFILFHFWHRLFANRDRSLTYTQWRHFEGGGGGTCMILKSARKPVPGYCC